MASSLQLHLENPPPLAFFKQKIPFSMNCQHTESQDCMSNLQRQKPPHLNTSVDSSITHLHSSYQAPRIMWRRSRLSCAKPTRTVPLLGMATANHSIMEHLGNPSIVAPFDRSRMSMCSNHPRFPFALGASLGLFIDFPHKPSSALYVSKRINMDWPNTYSINIGVLYHIASGSALVLPVYAFFAIKYPAHDYVFGHKLIQTVGSQNKVWTHTVRGLATGCVGDSNGHSLSQSSSRAKDRDLRMKSKSKAASGRSTHSKFQHSKLNVSLAV